MSKSAKEWFSSTTSPGQRWLSKHGLNPNLSHCQDDKTTYTSYDDQIITATVTIKNSGKAVAKNVDVNLNTGDLKLRGAAWISFTVLLQVGERSKPELFGNPVVPQLIDRSRTI